MEEMAAEAHEGGGSAADKKAPAPGEAAPWWGCGKRVTGKLPGVGGGGHPNGQVIDQGGSIRTVGQTSQTRLGGGGVRRTTWKMGIGVGI